MISPIISPTLRYTPLTPLTTVRITPTFVSPSRTVFETVTQTPIFRPLINTSRTTFTIPQTPSIVSLLNPWNTPIIRNTSVNLGDYYESGLNTDPIAQIQVRDYIHKRFFKKWLVNDFPKLLQYLKVVDGKVQVVKKTNKDNSNKVDETSASDNEAKIEFIKDRILDKDRTRKVLTKIIEENSIKWYNLPHNENLVKHVLAHYVKDKLKEMAQ
jgi:hypothetical protein